MEQPFHSVRTIQQKTITPQRALGMAAAVALQAGFVYALVSGLATSLVNKLPDVLKVDVHKEEIVPKAPPPPPPHVDLPPPPTTPPPEINISVDVPQTSITVTHDQPPPPKPEVHNTVITPVSIGRPHECASRFYPEMSLRLNEEGTALVSFKVMTDGSVSGVQVTSSTGHSRLDDATVTCVGKWRYKPQTVDGQAVEASWQAKVVWQVPKG